MWGDEWGAICQTNWGNKVTTVQNCILILGEWGECNGGSWWNGISSIKITEKITTTRVF